MLMTSAPHGCHPKVRSQGKCLQSLLDQTSRADRRYEPHLLPAWLCSGRAPAKLRREISGRPYRLPCANSSPRRERKRQFAIQFSVPGSQFSVPFFSPSVSLAKSFKVNPNLGRAGNEAETASWSSAVL